MLTIRSMQLSDIDEVCRIEQQAHQTPWSEDIFKDCLLVGYDCHVLESHEEKQVSIVGCVIARKNLTVYHILNLCISNALQGQGLGKYLLENTIYGIKKSEIDSIILEVRPSNHPAIALYEKFGFQKDLIKKDYYQDGTSKEDAWLLRKALY